MRTFTRKGLGVALAIGSLLSLAAAADGNWVHNVPAAARERRNPLAPDPKAVEAGRRLFSENCASCHGAAAQGIGKHPPLTSARIHDVTDGDLAWLLENGNLRKGMPSWSRLPDERRWQIIAYIRSLNNTGSPNDSAGEDKSGQKPM